ncbi:MAG: lipoprotein insertase outer membrane protein LolB [Gammaproteobacteria bacterium]|nr:lipoprotein insertase outer membrane protein LolB [Gammaproteobacteria bacterium]
MLRSLFFAFAVSVIAGCSQFASLSDRQGAQELWTSQQQALASYNSWDLHSRAVIKLETGAYNIGIRWQRDVGNFEMLLEAPFGQGVFRIESGVDDVYRLRLPDGQVFENHTAEALLEDVIGWSLPISGLEYWIRGMPRPGNRYSHRVSTDGRTRSIIQDRWTISYLDYFDEPQYPRLPRKVELVSDTIMVKLVVERWQSSTEDVTPSDLFPEFN